MTTFYKRRPTRTVYVGQVAIGGNNPIRVQSMTTSDTKDTVSIVREIEQLVQAGCEIVRLTVPTKADLNNLTNIRKELQSKRLQVPLVADIHFTPSIALDVVDYVEKVRINPGNYVDKKLFKSHDYTDAEYQSELARIEEKFIPLVEKCKERGVSMRVGTNHGSLSDRIMNRFGDTPLGMVESALEFLRIAASQNYYDIILSMKASNTQVMVNAYRLLAQRMAAEGFDHPFHLGVTEAGDAEDGRIKSAVGIGTLLEEGLGDTIRVSLTEDSVHEIPVAYSLVQPYNERFFYQRYQSDNSGWDNAGELSAQAKSQQEALFADRFYESYTRRETEVVQAGPTTQGGTELHRVWTSLDSAEQFTPFLKAQNVDMRFEGVEIEDQTYWPDFAEEVKAQNFALAVKTKFPSRLLECELADKGVVVLSSTDQLKGFDALLTQAPDTLALELCLNLNDQSAIDNKLLSEAVQTLKSAQRPVSLSLITNHPAQDYRLAAQALGEMNLKTPLHLRLQQSSHPLMIESSIQLGSLLIDGLGDSLQLETSISYPERLSLSYSLLQACRVRISKTEFIACPSCGRTLFDLQEVTAKIKARTDHLKGVKIAIMGCIVNGPGEMADADFGYVGTGTGKISLYVGKEVVKRNIPEEGALDELEALLKEHDVWVDQNSTLN